MCPNKCLLPLRQICHKQPKSTEQIIKWLVGSAYHRKHTKIPRMLWDERQANVGSSASVKQFRACQGTNVSNSVANAQPGCLSKDLLYVTSMSNRLITCKF